MPKKQLITVQDAQHVLHHFTGHGPVPGSFSAKLIEAYSAADPGNKARLATAFPSMAAAFNLASNQMDGIEQLASIAIGAEQ